jgi:hypothetical protein
MACRSAAVYGPPRSTIQSVPQRRPDQARTSSTHWLAIGGDAELRKQVENARRHRPAERQETAQLGAGVIGDEQVVRPEVEGRPRAGPQLVSPQLDETATSELAGDHADRLRPLAVRSPELEVHGPDLPIRECGETTTDLSCGAAL